MFEGDDALFESFGGAFPKAFGGVIHLGCTGSINWVRLGLDAEKRAVMYTYKYIPRPVL